MIRIFQTLLILTGGVACFNVALAQQSFKSPDDAVTALVAATRSDNNRDIIRILGDSARDLIFSGDPTSDAQRRAAFLIAYDARHQIVRKGDAAAELIIGSNDWTLPIPLVLKDGNWQFNTPKGREEILYRRIGRNELAAIQVALAYVDAQNDYANMNPSGGKVDNYAQRFVSTPGKKDGLYWPAAANEPQSPLGEAAVRATIEGYRFGGDGRMPYHGYYYKILTAQGPSAPGGAANYVVNGNMIGGFALVAYPAEYGNSGVMTFLVNHTGAIFQKDLGPRTGRIASRMTNFNPDHTWKKVPPEDVAGRN